MASKYRLHAEMSCIRKLKRFYILAFVAYGCFPVNCQVGDQKTYQIKSMEYGYVHHYGPYGDVDFLQFSLTRKPAHFIFTSKNALQLVNKTIKDKRCITRKTYGDQLLRLTGNCTLDSWIYDSSKRWLRHTKAPGMGCLSPWDHTLKPPPDLYVTTGVSRCSDWNEIILETVGRQAPKKHDGSNIGAIAGSVTGGILLLIIIVVTITFLLRRKMTKTRHEESAKDFHSVHGIRNATNTSVLELSSPKRFAKNDYSIYGDWDTLPENLQLLDKELGHGRFGNVQQGLLTVNDGKSQLVAVKTVKDNAQESDIQDLMAELTILKKANKETHPNVVKLLGSCSIQGKLCVITEFCPGGNLRTFLINSRKTSAKKQVSNYINATSVLNEHQLLTIAVNVAEGMIHLAKQKLVHRDLAARNILIGEDNIAKVSDFGLSRDIGGAEEYLRSNHNLLPVKWMALESLLYGRFTTASDVWSYGILLYEITTLGKEPYENISPYVIASHVGSGCRMSKPKQCSNELYKIMRNCWKVEPKDRPTFEEMCKYLKNMVEGEKLNTKLQ